MYKNLYIFILVPQMVYAFTPDQEKEFCLLLVHFVCCIIALFYVLHVVFKPINEATRKHELELARIKYGPRVVYTGSRGGEFYVTKSGNRVYI